MSVLGSLYHWGLKLDRKLARARTLSGAKVISVGNISVGGRAKSPLVVLLCRGLVARGFEPIVLTRGYGRKSRAAVTLAGDSIAAGVDALSAGDEPLEIWARTGATVLVGADRRARAETFGKRNPPDAARPRVFLLDDGFQHWRLRRDLDIVLIAPEDYGDRLLPHGRLREPATALQRADIVLELGRDVRKETRLGADLDKLAVRFGRVATDGVRAVTTRAPDATYRAALEARVGPIEWTELGDHATPAVVKRALGKTTERWLLVGGKEAVKLIESPQQLRAFFVEGHATVTLGKRKVELVLVDLALHLSDEAEFWNRITRAIGAAP